MRTVVLALAVWAALAGFSLHAAKLKVRAPAGLGTELKRIANNGNVSEFIQLLEANPKLGMETIVDTDDNTLLHVLIAANRAEMIAYAYFLREDVFDNSFLYGDDFKNKQSVPVIDILHGGYPITLSTMLLVLKMTGFALREGATRASAPLVAAVGSNDALNTDISALELLTEALFWNREHADIETAMFLPLETAVKQHNHKAFDFLADKVASMVSENREHLMAYAVKNNNVHVAKSLLQTSMSEENKQLLLETALYAGSVDVARFFVEAGVELTDASMEKAVSGLEDNHRSVDTWWYLKTIEFVLGQDASMSASQKERWARFFRTVEYPSPFPLQRAQLAD